MFAAKEKRLVVLMVVAARTSEQRARLRKAPSVVAMALSGNFMGLAEQRDFGTGIPTRQAGDLRNSLVSLPDCRGATKTNW
jgi:hypothetical protein